ncbi:eukaryotic long-chain fatty acid CoA synthetase (LC-FACS), variant 2 [Trifolium repens]|nr:eukaryotic long-chain fatty acid CoA synthetase (LC-FACS), variant 2 [Trifolium repens]
MLKLPSLPSRTKHVPFGKIMRCSRCLIIVSIAQPQQGCFLTYNYGLPQDKVAPWIHKLVFDKIKHALGGRVRLMLSGSAPLSMNVEEFLRVTFGATLAQGYGLLYSI